MLFFCFLFDLYNNKVHFKFLPNEVNKILSMNMNVSRVKFL